MLMKSPLWKAVIGCALLVPSTTAVGSEVTDPNLAAPTLVAWSQRVFGDLNDGFRYPAATEWTAFEGVVTVKFNCSDSGAPANVALFQSSGNSQLDAATVRAVKRIVTLHPLPSGMPHDQRFVVRVLFTDSADRASRRQVLMRAEADRSNAWFGRKPAIASVGQLSVGQD